MSATTLLADAMIAKSLICAVNPTSLTVSVAPSVEIAVNEGAVPSVRPAAVCFG